MRWLSAGQSETLAKKIARRIAVRHLLDRARVHVVGVPEDVSKALRVGPTDAEADRVGAAGGVVPIERPRAPTNRCRPTSTKNAARSRTIGPPSGHRQLFGRKIRGPVARRIRARQRLVLEVAGDRALPAVRARAGHRVHQPAGEVRRTGRRTERSGSAAPVPPRPTVSERPWLRPACRTPTGPLMPPRSELVAPSIWKPLSRSDCPAIEMPVSRVRTACGESSISREKS